MLFICVITMRRAHLRLHAARLIAHNFQVTPARGCAILAHVAAMPSASLCANRKYVLRGGRIDVAENGATECDPHLAEALYQFCVSKVQRFESKARE